ncbi:MAG: hypothetical protein KGH64_05100 [Candidatus Micrarchaeota archaeon]|nr:hypothetical protein [Candidatus Micrarchaeota archaeon]MDE1834688.1 hypothetical protein [Candidatus Micrarchaeota archaeon]MDE1859304.1 hypothetical protein [Candidatus Micrarchaeota archaeon]
MTQAHAQRGFREIPAATMSVYVLTDIQANRRTSMELLRNNSMRPLTGQEALYNLTKIKRLKEELKGKMFYLAEERTYESGLYAVTKTGTLLKARDIAPDPESGVFVYKGNYPPVLNVCEPIHYERYTLGGDVSPASPAQAVVGIKIANNPKEQAAISSLQRE